MRNINNTKKKRNKQKKIKNQNAETNKLLLQNTNYSFWNYFVKSDNIFNQEKKPKPKTWVERISKQIEPIQAEAKK